MPDQSWQTARASSFVRGPLHSSLFSGDLFLESRTWGMRSQFSFSMASRDKTHASILLGRCVDGQPTGRRALIGIRCGPIGKILVPGEDGIGCVRAFGQNLIVVDQNVSIAQLIGNILAALLKQVALNRRQVHTRQHDIVDAERIGSTIRGTEHVTQISPRHIDLAPHVLAVELGNTQRHINLE